jgi:hypothetical protein
MLLLTLLLFPPFSPTYVGAAPVNLVVPACDSPANLDGKFDSIQRILATVNSEQKCDLYYSGGRPALLNGKLTPYWAQEMVGFDLADLVMAQDNDIIKEVPVASYEDVHLATLPANQLSSKMQILRACYKGANHPLCDLHKKNIAQITKSDACFEWNSAIHGTLMTGVIFNDTPFRANAKTKLFASLLWNFDGFSNPINDLVREIEEQGIRLVASSKSFGDTNQEIENSIRANGLILVRSAGNTYPYPPQPLKVDSIIVSSLSPMGLTTATSQGGPEVTIAAPSDEFLNSVCGNKLFSQTSGAQPMVTAAVGNAMAYLPDLTLAEVKRLLVKTAIPTKNNLSEKDQNGEGTLNSLKLTLVARKLKAGWPKNRDRIMSDESLYDFETEAKEAQKKGLALLNSPKSCDLKMGLDLVRKAFLLDPKNQEIRETLHAFYRRQGLEMNALFFKSLSGVDVAFLREALEIENHTAVRAAVMRAAPSMKEEGQTFLREEFPNYYEGLNADSIGFWELPTIDRLCGKDKNWKVCKMVSN